MPKQVVIENPILNSPFGEPTRHFRFDDDGITDEIVAGRRESAYFIPIAQPRKKSKQLVLDTEWTRDRIKPNDLVNEIRRRVLVGASPLAALLSFAGSRRVKRARSTPTAQNLAASAEPAGLVILLTN